MRPQPKPQTKSQPEVHQDSQTETPKCMRFLYLLCLSTSKVCPNCSERWPIHMFETKSGLCEICDAQQEEKILDRSHSVV